MQYIIPITTWNKWNNRGIFVVNKDAHWPTLKLYSDILFMVDNNSIDIFVQAVNENNNARNYEDMHGVGNVLYMKNIPFHLIYEDYYHMWEHPLHVLMGQENEPDLDNPFIGTMLTDISQWN